MTLKDFIVFVIVGAGVGGFVHNNTVAVTQWLRQAFLKLFGWTKREAKIGVADFERLFQKHTNIITAAVAQVPAVTVAKVQQHVNEQAPYVETYNGVPIPTGLTLAQFTQLGVAKSGVARFLDPKADASVLDAIVNASDAWFSALGPYFVQQLVAQTAVGTPVGDRIRTFVTKNPVVEVVTPEQDAAAVRATS